MKSKYLDQYIVHVPSHHGINAYNISCSSMDQLFRVISQQMVIRQKKNAIISCFELDHNDRKYKVIKEFRFIYDEEKEDWLIIK